MGVKQVVRNIGNGRLFGHNRIFGMHNPLDYDINKARDPFISLRTLAKLSRCPDLCVKQQVARNLALRIDEINPLFLSRFDRSVIIDALAAAGKPSYPLDPRSPIARIVNEATQEELGKLVQSRSYGILSLIINNPDVPKSTKLDVVSLAIRNPAYDSLVHTAYKDLKDSLTAEDLHLFVDSILESTPNSGAIASFKVLLDIVQHQDTSRKTLLKLALVYSVNFVHAGFHSNIGLDAYNTLNENELTPVELTGLAISLNKDVLEKVGAHSKTPRNVRLELALKGVETACAAAGEFTLAQLEKLVNGLFEQYGKKQLPSNRPTAALLQLAKNPKTSPSNVARILSRITHKSRKIVDREATMKWDYVSDEDYAANGGDPATRLSSRDMVIDEPEQSHMEYSDSDLRYAEQMLSVHGRNRAKKILGELHTINPELASAIKSL
jgi:hypothetical protein